MVKTSRWDSLGLWVPTKTGKVRGRISQLQRL